MKKSSCFRYFLILSVILSVYLLAKQILLSTTNTTLSSSTFSFIPQFTNHNNNKLITAATWNVAAINNNPFEYWITNDADPRYNVLMSQVSNFITNPGEKDVVISKIFTPEMFQELISLLVKNNMDGTKELQTLWDNDYANRHIISQFLKDGILGKKRLISMPDRVTNTMHYTHPESKKQEILLRPTVVNCYHGVDLQSMTNWWDTWKTFMFHTTISSPKTPTQSTTIYEMIPKIDHNKYPTISVEEEKISRSLAILHLAIFDSILVHMMNNLNKEHWQDIRNNLCNNLNLHKNDRTKEILSSSWYSPVTQVVFLQETSNAFFQVLTAADTSTNHLTRYYNIHRAANAENFHRDQTSMILLRKGLFENVQEVTTEVVKVLSEQMNNASDGSTPSPPAPKKKKLPIDDGDFFAIKTTRANECYLLASFHGDTNGLATIPMVQAMHTYATNMQPQCKLLFGLDANSHAHADNDQLGVLEFAYFYTSKKLNSCYGPTPNPLNFTTFHARTHLQPQLNKAITLEEKDKKGDKNPKDFILFFDADFEVLQTIKDNTGEKKYIENMVFPTLKFPSDHGITSTVLQIKPPFKSKGLRSLS